MAKFMMYERDSNGTITRMHSTININEESINDYKLKEHLLGWPEDYVMWRVMGDMSCIGVAPMSDNAKKLCVHYSMI